MKIINKIFFFFSGLLGEKVPQEYQKELRDELINLNYLRCRNLSLILTIVLVVLIFMDLDGRSKGYWLTVPGYRILFYAHLILGLGLLLLSASSFLDRFSKRYFKLKQRK